MSTIIAAAGKNYGAEIDFTFDGKYCYKGTYTNRSDIGQFVNIPAAHRLQNSDRNNNS